ncbi:MAG: YggS family pyridoxal phosphate-dependent enzyme [Phycisphaerales bacterium JB039]
MDAVCLEDRFTEVRQRVADAASRAGRRPQDVLLVAVTKYAEPDQIRELLHLGHRDLAENHVQQLIQRAAMIDEYLDRRRVLARTPGDEAPAVVPARWHLIGPLQRNKAKKAVEICRLIHTVDSLRIAEELQEIGLKREQPIDVLIQVNCSGEASKAGCPTPAARHLAAQIDSMVYVRARGLMTMAPESDNPEDSRPIFARCRELLEDIATEGVGEGRFNILSMGMTQDYEVAISEGANLVRIGSAIFGPRPVPAA